VHLSDWHHHGMDFNRGLMRNELLRDIQGRIGINDKLLSIDFILFSGDIANKGAKAEFEEAKTELIDPLRACIGKTVPIYCVPGNHDIERDKISKISVELRNQISDINASRSWDQFNNIVTMPETARQLNIPFDNFFDFLETINCKYDRSKLHSVHTIEKGGIRIGLICLNTAWNSARYEINYLHEGDRATAINPLYWDYGLLRISEAQLQQAIDELGAVDLVLLMMHHPLHWMDELERAKLEQTLYDRCHVVIHGHEHRPNTSQISSAFGDLMFIPAGASYAGRTPEDPRYTNAYNFGVVDANSFEGTVFHRMWSEENKRWQADDRYWLDGQSQFVLNRRKHRDAGVKLARKSIINSAKQYIPFIGKRGALDQEVAIRHDSELVDGEPFIVQKVKIRIKLRAGPAEIFSWGTVVDEMVLDHPNKKVRDRAYKRIGLRPEMKKAKLQKMRNIFRWEGELDEREQWLEYEYEKLELPNNFYFLNISRFTDRVKLTIKQATGYQYAYLPIGGFPELKLTPDKLLSVDTVQTEVMVLPSQGYIIQWRPEQKSGRKTGQPAANPSNSSRGKVGSRKGRDKTKIAKTQGTAR
jgi:predicted phosphodiesterase